MKSLLPGCNSKGFACSSRVTDNYLKKVLEKKIIFQDRKEAVSLLGKNDVYLHVLNENFDCRMISRGDALEIIGEEEIAAQVVKIVEELQYLYRQGTTLTMHEIRYSINLVQQGKSDELHHLFSSAILVTAKGRQVRPKTLGQRMYINVIRHNSITFGIGPAGTGKTYLAVAMAVAALRNHEVDKIILTRPVVEAGEHLGFLPGDLQEKVDPYLRPLYDALQDIMGIDTYQKLMAKNIIEIAPLAYMRGRTLDAAFVILDEAQNTTGKQMKMFLTRLGFGSKMVVTGDLGQIDLRGTRSGLAEASEVLQDVEGVGGIYLDVKDVIRHDVVARIVQAYDAYEEKKSVEV